MDAYFYEALFTAQNLALLGIATFFAFIILFGRFVIKKNREDALTADSVRSEVDAAIFVHYVQTKPLHYSNAALFLVMGIFACVPLLWSDYNPTFIALAVACFAMFVHVILTNRMPQLLQYASVGAKIYGSVFLALSLGAVAVMLYGAIHTVSSGSNPRLVAGWLSTLPWAIPGLIGCYYFYKYYKKPRA